MSWKTAFRSFYYETAEEPDDIELVPAETALLVIDIQNTYVAPKDVEKAIDLSLGELEAVTSASLPDTEVESFKAKINNGFPFKFETISDTLEQYLYLAVDGVDVSWLETYTDRIAAPTPAEVNAALSVITPASMTLVAVGNRDLIPVLARYGKVEVVSATDFLESGLTHATAAE